MCCLIGLVCTHVPQVINYYVKQFHWLIAVIGEIKVSESVETSPELE